jgi:phosphoribosylformylglycinamidine cyclo-ligase
MVPSENANSEPEMIAHSDHYKESGVDTDEADAGLHRLTARIVAGWPRPGAAFAVKLPVGHFANVIDFGNGIGVAISTDGVGSKALIAHQLGRYETIGIDCIAMNVNDIVCVGARPVSMVDYVAIEEVSASVLDAISIGLSEGARRAQISICGGETAQLKDMVHGFDLAGTAIGHVALDKILIGQDIRDGDAVVGVESNGIHSNGLTLARRAVRDSKTILSARFDELGTDLGTELLRPTHIYVREAMQLIERVPRLKALAHITSDGFLNLTRFKEGIGFVIDRLPDVPAIFQIIQRLGKVELPEMFSVFNMGIGFCAIVAPESADAAIAIFKDGGFRSCVIGHAVKDELRTVCLPQFRLNGRGKHFWAAE